MPYSSDVRRWGIAKESVRLTAEAAPTKWLTVDPGSEIKHELKLLEDKGLRGIKAKYPAIKGIKVTEGKFSGPVRVSNFGEFLQMVFGSPSLTAEQTSYTVVGHTVFTVETGVNDKIDFIEGAGAEKTATLTAGAYTAYALCAEIKTQLETANATAVTYTVAFNSTTKKFTITPSASTVTLLWLTGTNNATACYALLGWGHVDAVAAAAQTSTTAVTFVAANDALDFTEDGGSEVNLFLTAGTYVAGTSSAVTGSLCKLIKDIIEAGNGAATYTVTYSYSTKKFTITKNSGVFVMKITTGINAGISAGALLGFTADSASAIAAVSDSTATAAVFKHTFSLPSSIQPTTYTFFVDRSLGVKAYNGIAVKKMALKSTVDGYVQHDSDLIGLNEADGSIGSPVYTDETTPLTFQDVTVKVGGASDANIKEWALTIDPGTMAKRVLSSSQVAADVLAPNMMKVQGSFTIYFENETERAKFIAGTTNYLQFLIAGETIIGTQKETLDINLYKIHYTAYPYGEVDGLLGAQVSFDAEYSVSDSKMIQVDLTNEVVSY